MSVGDTSKSRVEQSVRSRAIMDNEMHVLADKILRDIVSVLKEDNRLLEFDIIPVEENVCNKSPVVHVEHRIGIESWCVKFVYMYAYNQLMEKIITKPSPRVNSSNIEEANRLLIGVLLLNPDVPTFWNLRREMVVNKYLKLKEEMKLCHIVLTRKAKSNETFAYRRWLLEYFLKDLSESTHHSRTRVIISEFWVVCNYADKSPNNYHACTHRIWFIKYLQKHYDSAILNYIYSTQYHITESWMSAHISDHSGFRYRQFILDCLVEVEEPFTALDSVDKLDEALNIVMNKALSLKTMEDVLNPISMKRQQQVVESILTPAADPSRALNKYLWAFQSLCLLMRELLTNEEMSSLYVAHETLWYHRRYILHATLKILEVYFNSDDSPCHSMYGELKDTPNRLIHNPDSENEEACNGPKIFKSQNHLMQSCSFYTSLMSHERHLIDQRQGDPFAEKYETWLRTVLIVSV